MSMNVPALGINIKGLNANLSEVGENKFAIPGITPSGYEGFGQVQNMANTNDVAYFFANYADESTNMNGPACNIRISTDKQESGGRRLISDIVTRAGDDLILSQDELQAWADEIGFSGDINEVMETMGEMDKWLCGEGTLDVEQVDPQELEQEEPQESQGLEEGNGSDVAEEEPQEENPSLKGVIMGATKGAAQWVVNGLTGFWNWLFG